MKFSIIHPSRKRPKRSFETVDCWLNSAVSKDIEVIISIDETETYKDRYWQYYGSKSNCRLIVRDNRCAVDAINNAAKEATGDILIVVSDDTDCKYKWDQDIIQATHGKEDFVLKVYDGIQNWMVTMPVMDRKYYERFGYIYYPEFKHMFCDTFLTHQADALKKIIWRNDITIRHNHYSVTKSQKDETTFKADGTLQAGCDLYMNLVKKNLLLDSSVNIWNLKLPEAQSHLTWCKNKGII